MNENFYYEEDSDSWILKSGPFSLAYYVHDKPNDSTSGPSAATYSGTVRKTYPFNSKKGTPERWQNNLMLKLFELACKEDELGLEKIGAGPRTKVQELVKSLAQNLDPNLASFRRETLLHIAAKYGRTEIMDILRYRGARNVKTLFGRYTPEDYLNSYKKNKQAQIACLSNRKREHS